MATAIFISKQWVSFLGLGTVFSSNMSYVRSTTTKHDVSKLSVFVIVFRFQPWSCLRVPAVSISGGGGDGFSCQGNVGVL